MHDKTTKLVTLCGFHTPRYGVGLCSVKDLVMRHNWLIFAQLDLSVGKAACHKKAIFFHFKLIIEERYLSAICSGKKYKTVEGKLTSEASKRALTNR